MTFQETLEYLYACLPMYQRIGKAAFKKDLNNTLAFCEKLGNPQEKFKSVHIAGTNGKGSSAHTIAAILQLSGFTVGLYTSPHLKSFTERIKVNGREMEQEAVVRFVGRHKSFIERLQPSFFEMTVAMAFDYFASEKVDYAVIEVGLGGRFDSTNVIRPEISLITNISYDHSQMLGATLQEIAYEKAGIIKKDVPAVVGEYDPGVVPVFCARAAAVGAPVHFASKEYVAVRRESDLKRLHVDIRRYGAVVFENIPVGLTGDYQLKNIPGILKTIDLLKAAEPKISESAVKEGLLKAKELTGLKGRWQILGDKPTVICDTAHNEQGLSYIFNQLSRCEYRRLRIVFGMVSDKATSEILKLLPKEGYYYFCQADIPRAMDAERLCGLARECGLAGEVVKDVNEAAAKAVSESDAEDLIFIGGSSFVVAELNQL